MRPACLANTQVCRCDLVFPPSLNHDAPHPLISFFLSAFNLTFCNHKARNLLLLLLRWPTGSGNGQTKHARV